MARPTRDPNGKRGVNLVLWLTPDEAEKLRQIAADRGVAVSRLVAAWIARLK